METPLYPFKFLPLFKNKVWGGNKIKSLGFNYDPLPNCGELWALSSLPGNESVIANGFLAENTINEALEIYMSEILGEKNFDHFGTDFPLLFKIIDANDDLSIQVHPDDHLAQQRGMPFGKTEMWYVIESDPGATIVDGFSRQTTPEQYQQHLEQGNLEQLLHLENTHAGDTFFIPAGRVHAIGKGNLFAEIQQSSDCTYRIYDYNRPDTNGQLRQLHIAEALDAIDFSPTADGKTHYQYSLNSTTQPPLSSTSASTALQPSRASKPSSPSTWANALSSPLWPTPSNSSPRVPPNCSKYTSTPPSGSTTAKATLTTTTG